MRVTLYLPRVAIILVALAACHDVDPASVAGPPAPGSPSRALLVSETGVFYSPILAAFNDSLSASGVQSVRVLSAEIAVSYASEEWTGATTLIANNRDHTINSQFVASDPRRGGSANITYVVDQSDGSALSFATATPTRTVVTLPNAITESQIDASMAFWGNQPYCGPPGAIKVADSGGNVDLIDDLIMGGPIGTSSADITHGGWLPRAFFDRIAPNGGSFILGVTFTFIFVDAAGNPTDIDRDGRSDVAFREIYYNRAFPWGNLSLPELNVDIQSVAIHEAGHAYGLGHFGKVFLDAKGNFQYAPKAIMNAVYIEPFRELTGTDVASFCQIWAKAN